MCILFCHIVLFLFLIYFHCAQCNLKAFVFLRVAKSFTQTNWLQKCSGTKQETLVQKLLKLISTIYDQYDLKSNNCEIKNNKTLHTKG